MKEKLLNINGQYVKFYVTTNSALPKVMQNTGALVIYCEKPENSTDESNKYIYLGNEIIAGGVGFKTKELRDKAEKIVTSWDSVQENINNSIDDLNQNVDDIWDKINGAGNDITSSTITYNGETHSLYDMFFNAKTAEYNKLEIVDYYNTVEYYDINLKTDNQLNSTSNLFWDDEKIIVKKVKGGEPIELPVGAKIKTVSSVFKIKHNDESIAQLFANYKYADALNLNNVVNGKFKEKNITVDVEPSADDIAISIYKISMHYDVKNNFEKTQTFNEQYFVCKGSNIISDGIHIVSKGTVKPKPYIFLSTKDGKSTQFQSVQNIILPNEIKLDPIEIIGKSCIYTYAYTKIPEYDRTNSIDVQYNGTRTALTEQVISMDIPAGSTRYYIAIPDNFNITEIYHITENSEKQNITGLFTGPDKNDNTGYYFNIYPYINTVSNNTNIYDVQSIFYCEKYKIYYMTHSDNMAFIENYKIYINVEEVKTNPVVKYNINTFTDVVNQSYIAIQNEDYKTSHWMHEDFMNIADLRWGYYFTDIASDGLYTEPVYNFNRLNKTFNMSDIHIPENIQQASVIYGIIPKVMYMYSEFYYMQNNNIYTILPQISNEFVYNDIPYIKLFIVNSTAKKINIRLADNIYIGQNTRILYDAVNMFNTHFMSINNIDNYYIGYGKTTDNMFLYSQYLFVCMKTTNYGLYTFYIGDDDVYYEIPLANISDIYINDEKYTLYQSVEKLKIDKQKNKIKIIKK